MASSVLIRRILAFGSLLLLSSCTAVIVEGYPVDTCEGASDCAALNELGVLPGGVSADDCHAWRCGAAGVCEYALLDADDDGAIAPECEEQALRELAAPVIDCNDADPLENGLEERCDGVDNDCDGWIDESLLAEAEPVPHVSAVAGVARVTTVPGEVSAGVAWSGGRSGSYAEPGWDETRDLGYRSTPSGPGVTAGTLDLADGCFDADELTVPSSCDVSDLAVSIGGGARFAAAINLSGCAAVRVGLIDAERDRIEQLGPGRRSSSYLGLDPDPLAPGCVRDDASAIVIEADGEDRALVGWLTRGPMAARCAFETADVRAVVVHRLEDELMSVPHAWLTATGEGEAVTLGQTRVTSPPAIVAYGDGWIVAYVDELGAVTLSRLAAPDAPPNPMDTSLFPGAYDADPDARPVEIAVAQLSGWSTATLDGSSEADAVVATLADLDGTVVRLGLAWRERICSGVSRIMFSEAELDLTDGSLIAAPTLREIAAAELAEVGPPSIAYRASGVAVSGRGEASAAGGYVIAWGEGPAAVDGVRPRDELRVVQVAERSGRNGASLTAVASSAPGPRYGSVQTDGMGVASLYWFDVVSEAVMRRPLSCSRE